jgi:hypothetical protein
MAVEETKKYVKDALVVWSSYLTRFTPLEWELTKKRPKNPKSLITEFGYDYIYINTMFGFATQAQKESLFTINAYEWESSLILYTDKICKVFLAKLKTEDFIYQDLPTYPYLFYRLDVTLLSKPNELDFLQSLADLNDLKKRHNIKLPSLITKN